MSTQGAAQSTSATRPGVTQGDVKVQEVRVTVTETNFDPSGSRAGGRASASDVHSDERQDVRDGGRLSVPEHTAGAAAQ
jgi:hypothetical protein